LKVLCLCFSDGPVPHDWFGIE